MQALGASWGRGHRRRGTGWQAQGAYTWAKSLDTSSASIQTAYTNSVSSLPLFDANRGAIRIERATREQLHEEYAQRLLTARGDIARLLAAQQILASREAELAPFAATLAATAEHASQAYARGATDWTVYLASRQSALAAAVELIAVRESLAQTRIGLATLLAGNWAA